jgi:hypothetical protein
MRYPRDVIDDKYARLRGDRGMGLTMAQQLLETQGGSIDIMVDGRGKGATVRLRFPRKKSRATISALASVARISANCRQLGAPIWRPRGKGS